MKKIFLFMLLVFMFFSTLIKASTALAIANTKDIQRQNLLLKAKFATANNQNALRLLANFKDKTSSSTQLEYFNKLKYSLQIDLFEILSLDQRKNLFPKLILELQKKLLPKVPETEQNELFKLMVASGQITDHNKNDFLKYCSVTDKERLLSLYTREKNTREKKLSLKYEELKKFNIENISENPEKLRELRKLVEEIYRESRTGDLLERLASLNAKNDNEKQRDFIEDLLFGTNPEVDAVLSVNKNLYEVFVGNWRLAMQDKKLGKEILAQDVANLREYTTQLKNDSLSAKAKAYLKNLIDTLNKETRGEATARFTALKDALSSDSDVLALLNQTGDNYQALNPSNAEQDQQIPIAQFDTVNDSINPSVEEFGTPTEGFE